MVIVFAVCSLSLRLSSIVGLSLRGTVLNLVVIVSPLGVIVLCSGSNLNALNLMITIFYAHWIELRFLKQNYRTMSHKVFVYGTLKRNEPNHHWLTNKDHGHSKFINKGVTDTKYPLIIATKYNIPFLLFSPGNGFNVKGEIYEVCDDMLKNLDILEDHPSYYIRELDDIKVIKEGTDEVVGMKCWVYFLKKFKPELLNLPFLENYSSKGGHGLPYMERSKRDPNYNYKREVTD